MSIASTPAPPYYAVIFTSLRTEGENGYKEMSDRMNELAATMPGFLGQETVREELVVSVSYWKTLDDVRNWKKIRSIYSRRRKEKVFGTRLTRLECVWWREIMDGRKND